MIEIVLLYFQVTLKGDFRIVANNFLFGSDTVLSPPNFIRTKSEIAEKEIDPCGNRSAAQVKGTHLKTFEKPLLPTLLFIWNAIFQDYISEILSLFKKIDEVIIQF